MLSSKQRAKLRGMAAGEPTLFQLGKEGVTETFLASCDSALNARELIKLSALKTAPVSAREAGEYVASKLKAEFVAAIGNKFILYRYSADNPSHIDLGK